MDSENEDATKITPALGGSRICLFIHEDDDIGHVHGCYNQFSQCLTFILSQCCRDNVDIKAHWCL